MPAPAQVYISGGAGAAQVEKGVNDSCVVDSGMVNGAPSVPAETTNICSVYDTVVQALSTSIVCVFHVEEKHLLRSCEYNPNPNRRNRPRIHRT